MSHNASPTPAARSTSAWRTRLSAVASYGALVLLLAGVPLRLLDWWAGWNLTRLWAQVCATVAGCLLVGLAARLRSLHAAWRSFMLAGGLLLLAAVLDSLDGQQDLLTVAVVLWGAFALEFAGITTQLLLARRPHNLRWWAAIIFGSALALFYAGAAARYAYLNAAVAPIQVDSHPLNGAGTALTPLLLWLGELGTWATPLRGHVRVCPSCGLRNIRERRTCKRCRSALGPVEYVN